MTRDGLDRNLDKAVIDGFGLEWSKFSYIEGETDQALNEQFLAYTSPIEMQAFNKNKSVAADFGAGSGRWTSRLLPYFSKIYALEPSDGANEVLIGKFAGELRIEVLQETVGKNSIPDFSLDLAMSLGVLHHIPDTGQAIKDIAIKIKPGGMFLCYLYYKLEDKPLFYNLLFSSANYLRLGVSRLPYFFRVLICNLIAASIYVPLAALSKYIGRKGKNVSNIPLHHYANMPFIMMQNDALDRFGTRLEQRFSREEISDLVELAGFDVTTLKFSDNEPFWTFSVKKKD